MNIVFLIRLQDLDTRGQANLVYSDLEIRCLNSFISITKIRFCFTIRDLNLLLFICETRVWVRVETAQLEGSVSLLVHISNAEVAKAGEGTCPLNF